MKLKRKLPFFTSIILFLSITTVSILSIYQFQKEIKKNIQSYRVEATEQILNNLKDIVDIAYSMVDNSFQLSNPDAVKTKYGIELQDTSHSSIKMITMNMMKITLGNLRVLRFGTDGYIWINEFEPPYTVVLHPKPELEGKAWVFYFGNTDINVYEAFHDSIASGNGAGRVSYNFFKPGTNERIPKISWVRLYEPLGWVIGTGVYVDYIDKIVTIKEQALSDQIRRLILTVAVIGSFFILLSIILLTIFARSITNPIYQIQMHLYEMAKGKIVEKLKIERVDEIGEMKNSLDALIDGLVLYAKFANEIGKGNFKAEFEKLSNEDMLGNALMKMRNNLDQARKQEQERLEQEKRQQWINEGINRVGDIITISTQIQTLAENVISYIVEYTKAVMGSLFILDFDESGNSFLKLTASVAYNRKKFAKKEIELNEGLVGACFMEKEPINLTEIPENYIEIKTGLGTTNPKNIYLNPLQFENKVYGVLEFASFTIFPKHVLSLIEETCKLLAVSLSTKDKFA
ncbi:MAG: cache domain-containing protein, partial [Bacteroidota bacterium]|nr:cache domain-containing protein [Bacteroidota bacterium]